MKPPNFLYGSCACGLLWENHTLCAGKILKWPKFGHLWPKIGHFWPNLKLSKVFGLSLPNSTIKLSNFWYESCYYMFFFRKKIDFMLGKFWDDQNLAICCQNLAIFDQNWHFWEFLTYNFQTPLQIFLKFALETNFDVFFQKK